MTDQEIDRLISTIHEIAFRFGAAVVPDDVKVIIFKRAGERARQTSTAKAGNGEGA